jgi:hypothetical protein
MLARFRRTFEEGERKAALQAGVIVRSRASDQRTHKRKPEVTKVVWEYAPELAKAMCAQYDATQRSDAGGMRPPHDVRQLLHERHGVHPSTSILASVFLCDFMTTHEDRMRTLESGSLPRGVVVTCK